MTHNMSATSLHHLLPTALHPFVTLSYPVSSHSKLHSAISSRPPDADLSTPTYGKGPNDVYFVAFCALAFTVLRGLTMRYVLAHFARWWLESEWRIERQKKEQQGSSTRGMTKLEKRRLEHTVTRFAEQGWSLLYCTVFWVLGVYILTRLPAPLSPESLWGSYPVTTLPPATKFYYLAQLGWWFHQIYVINTEKRRGDHWQMFGHHILTIILMVGSYKLHYTRVGMLIHTLMDLCDIFLPLAKMLRYLSLFNLCDATFVIFLLAWLMSRQIGLAFVIRTAAVDAPRFIPYGWDPARNLYLTPTVYNFFIGMLCLLYCLASIWFYMAVRVAVRVARGLGAEDSRSDEEDNDEEDETVSTRSTVKVAVESVPDLANPIAGGDLRGDVDEAGSTVRKRR